MSNTKKLSKLNKAELVNKLLEMTMEIEDLKNRSILDEEVLSETSNTTPKEKTSPVLLRVGTNSNSSSKSADEALAAILNKLEVLETAVENIEAENKHLRKQLSRQKKVSDDALDDIYFLQRDLTSLQQYSRRWNVEICNIPEDVEQDQLLPTIVHALGQMEVPINPADIEIVHRLYKPKNSSEPAKVICRFKDRNITYKVMKNRKYVSKIEKNTISQTATKNLFIHENLAPMNKEIFDFCVERKKAGEIHKVWTFKGVVNLVHTDNVQEKPTKIYHYDDLWNIFPED